MKEVMEQSWIIGRSADCDLVILDKKVSGRHCRLTQTEKSNGFLLEDLGSSNGTFVNGKKLQKPTSVTPKDHVILGRRSSIPWPLFLGEPPVGTLPITLSAEKETQFGEPAGGTPCARLLLYDDLVILEDQGCPNGVAVGVPERRVKRAILSPDDALYIDAERIDPERWIAAIEQYRLEKQEEELASATAARNAAIERNQNIGSRLVDIGVLREADWESAIKAVGEDAEVDSLLHHIERIRRPGPSGDDEPLLTHFQTDLILAEQWDELHYGEFVIRDRIGRGGMGEVFRGRSPDGKLDVAVKVLTKVSRELRDEDAHRRFLREARLLERLNHANFTTYYGSGEHHGDPYIVMEYLEGKTIDGIVRDGLAANEKTPIPWTIDAAMIIASALDHAHKNNVIHRDIKPSNIMVTRDGKLKLVDLGIGRLVGMASEDNATINAPLTQQGTGLGTPEYMAPEQWRDATQVTPATDIYSLGCTFFFLLAARPPFQGSLIELMKAHALGPPPSIRQYRSEVPRKLDKVLQKMMATKPEDRYTSAADLADDLSKCQTPDFPWKAIAAAAALVLLAGLGWLFW